VKIQRLVFLLIPIIVLVFLIDSITASTNKPVNGLTVTKQHQTFNSETDNHYTLELTQTLYLPIILNDWCSSYIEFSNVPAYGSFDDLDGQVNCVDPDDYKIAVYIFVNGWWTKPTFANPLTDIQSDGTWSTDITTGGLDEQATKIAAFLLPNNYSPPLMSGGALLPQILFDNAIAHIIAVRDAVFRTIEFSGYTWRVKSSGAPVGPGPNYFSDREEDIWVDEDGKLHLWIVFRDGTWYSTEVLTTAPLGYGTYTFVVGSPVDTLDKNVVLGLFTWDDTAPDFNYREIDIEFSRWQEENGENSQYVVQPYYMSGNRHRFDMQLLGMYSTHSFDWREDQILFSSYQGNTPPFGPSDEIETWLYTGDDIPPEGIGNARINLWLIGGEPPSGGQEVEVIVEAFEFSE
jgi:hypothetical protein